MAARHFAFALGACALVTAGMACVDLFHDTDFTTLCSRSPSDPRCDANASHDAGNATEAGDATKPHPDFCAWTSPEARTHALRACAWLGACEGVLGESVFGRCVVRAQLAFDCGANPSLRPAGSVDAFWACLATVSSCGDVDRCVFPAGVQDCSATTGSFTQCATVPGNTSTLVKCTAGAGTRPEGIEPCVLRGEGCSNESSSAASCTGPLGFDKCTRNECSGTAAVDCNPLSTRTIDRGMDCTGYGGAACVPGDGGPLCAAGPNATSCDANSPPACDGSVVTSCVAGKEIRVDCARLGLSCDVSSNVPTYDPTAACGRRTGPDVCADGDTCVDDHKTLQSCGRGAPFTIDCASVGLGPCAVGSSGRAACTRL